MCFLTKKQKASRFARKDTLEFQSKNPGRIIWAGEGLLVCTAFQRGFLEGGRRGRLFGGLGEAWEV